MNPNRPSHKKKFSLAVNGYENIFCQRSLETLFRIITFVNLVQDYQ